jgi:hypothetical protein
VLLDTDGGYKGYLSRNPHALCTDFTISRLFQTIIGFTCK